MEKNTAASHATTKLAGDGYGAENGATPFIGEGTDWQDVMALRIAMTYKANATISGGFKKADFLQFHRQLP